MANRPDNSNRADELVKALDLWVSLTGVDPSATRFSFNLGGGMDSYTVKQMYDQVKEALELDPTNITGQMLLDALSTIYFQERSFSVAELLEDPEKTSRYVALAREFRSLVQSDEIKDIGREFEATMRKALKHYGAESEATLAVLNDSHSMAFLRRDALRSIENLRVDQFLAGEPETDGTAPRYNEMVHQFWNINSLVEAACRQPSGITLSLIRDPSDYHSYFAFAIRNGGNLYVLSDVSNEAHPLARYMSRRPDRSFSSRAGRNWFPYHLMNLVYDEENSRLYFDPSKQRGLVPIQQDANQLAWLSDLEAEETLWIIMMYDLIVDRFWNKGYQAESLSYTAQMIREETPLLEAAEKAQLPVAGYETLSLKPLKVADVRKDVVSERAIGKDCGSHNQWLEDRYADRAHDSLMNVMSIPGEVHYLTNAQATKRDLLHEAARVQEGGLVTIDEKTNEKVPFWEKEGRYALHALDPGTFGTREKLEEDRLFLARHNLAKAVQRLADQEYEARKDEIFDWWEKAVKSNIEVLYQLSVADEVWRKLDTERFPGVEGDGNRNTRNWTLFAQRYTKEEMERSYGGLSSGVNLNKGYPYRGTMPHCYITGAVSTYRVYIQPSTATDLAYLAGCQVEELPDVLQHWCARDRHKGNHILNRIDPMSWAVSNPWQDMNFKISLALSKRALSSLEKRLTPPEGYQGPNAEKASAGQKDGQN